MHKFADTFASKELFAIGQGLPGPTSTQLVISTALARGKYANILSSRANCPSIKMKVLSHRVVALIQLVRLVGSWRFSFGISLD